ncbi:MAG: transcriptional repressor [Synergistaceae bacterium]|nr:transcriptional repressor [Synergistaceae bacterium]
MTVDEGIKYLQSSGAKITETRVAIMRSLEDRCDHPSAEQLFIELKPKHPTLSIATVYSTTQLLAKASLLRILSIDEKKVYFDPNLEPHGHFLCKSCKRVFDVPVDFDAVFEFDAPSCISSVDTADVFYYGLCVKCDTRRRTTSKG